MPGWVSPSHTHIHGNYRWPKNGRTIQYHANVVVFSFAMRGDGLDAWREVSVEIGQITKQTARCQYFPTLHATGKRIFHDFAHDVWKIIVSFITIPSWLGCRGFLI